MAKNLKSGILITGDASGAVKATQLTREEMAKLNKTTQAANQLAKEHAMSLDKIRGFADTSAKALAGMGAAGAAALSAIVKSGTDAAKEIAIMSRLAGTSAEEFQAMSFAASTVGVETDKFADIMKDVQDKVGDFLQNGGGPMKDFFDNIAPQVGVTAEQFKNLSGPQALELYVSSLEKANLSNAEMTFYMEAIASDATLLLPLMQNNAQAFKALGEEAQQAGLYLSEIDIQNLVELDNTFLQITQTFDTLTNIVAAELAPFIQVLADEFLAASVNANDFREYVRGAIETLAKGVGFFADMVKGIQLVSLGFEKLFRSIGIGWGQVIDGGRLFVKGIEVQVAEAELFFAEFWSGAVELGVDAANAIIEALNKIPGFGDIEKIEFPAPDTSAYEERLTRLKTEYDTIQNGIVEGFKMMGEEWSEFGDALQEEFPSAAINRKVNEIFENTAKKSAETKDAVKQDNQEIVRSYDSILDKVQANGRAQEIMLDDLAKKSRETAGDVKSSLGGVFSELDKQFAGLGSTLSAGFDVFTGGLTAENALGLGQGLGGLIGNSLGGEFGGAGSQLGSFAGSALFGPLGGVLGGVFGGALGGLFGGEESDKTQSVQVNLATGQLTQGGFGGDKFSQENRTAADDAGQAILDLMRAIEEETGKTLEGVVDLAVGSRDGIDLIFDGNTILNNVESLEEAVSAVFETMVGQAGLSVDVYRSLAQEGESFAATFLRVEAQFTAVTTAADTLGLQFNALGDDGLLAADALVQAVGGLNEFVAETNFFYNNFFTEQERMNDLTERLTATFGELGLAIPETELEFKNLVLGLDLTTESGQETYATLLDLAPEMLKYIDNLDKQKTVVEEYNAVQDSMTDSMVNLGLAVRNAADYLQNTSFVMDQLDGESYAPPLTSAPTEVFGPFKPAIEAANDTLIESFVEPTQEVIAVVEEYNGVVEDSVDNVVQLIDYEKERATATKAVASAYKSEAKELESFIGKMGKVAVDLRAYSDSLLIGDLSSLNPQQQYAEARRQFMAASESGVGLKSASQSFLSESREFQGSAGSYASDFELVRSTLNATADLADRQKDSAEKQLAQLEKIVSENIELKKEVKTLNESVAALIEVNKAAANAQLNESAKQTDALQGLKSNSDVQVSAA